jgi:hypothetical protein
MLTFGSALSAGVKSTKKGAGKMVYMIIAIVSLGLTLIGAIVKSIWFKVPYAHDYVMMRNERLKLDKNGSPIVKRPGWRLQVPIRDDKKPVDCTVKTSELKPQNLMAGDEKNEVCASIRYHVLSWRDGEDFRNHPVRTLMVDDLNQAVEEICRDAIREILGKSDAPACEWQSKDLYRAVKRLVRRSLEKIGVRLDGVMLPNSAPSEAQTQGDLIKQGFQLLAGQATEEEAPEIDASTEPSIHAVPS